MEDDEIRTLCTRLGRRHPSGGTVVERAAILAEGVDFNAVVAWIVERGGTPETAATPTSGRGRGLHSDRVDSARAATQTPLRYVLPPGALDAPEPDPAPPPPAAG
jgi:hypothetical protein